MARNISSELLFYSDDMYFRVTNTFSKLHRIAGAYRVYDKNIGSCMQQSNFRKKDCKSITNEVYYFP